MAAPRVQLGMSAIKKLCQAFGINDQPIRRLVLDISHDGIAVAYTDQFVSEAQFEGLLDVIIKEGKPIVEDGVVETTSQLNDRFRSYQPVKEAGPQQLEERHPEFDKQTPDGYHCTSTQ